MRMGKRAMKKKIRFADIIIYMVTIGLALACLLPLLNMVAISFSNSAAATAGRVGILPVDFTVNSYTKLLKEAQYWRSLMISFARTVLGTIINIVLVILMAYPLSKSTREFYAQKVYMRVVLFAMLFNGGMIPTYLVVNKLGLCDTLWALILPSAVGVGNVILLMNFFRSVPKELEEATQIDGANPFQTLWNVFIPMSKPCIATIILFCAVGHWNDYFTGILYISKIRNYPLQTYIQSVTASFDISRVTDPKKIQEYLTISEKTLNAAKIVVSTLPLMIIYPFVTKYFKDGIVVGAVKE